MSNYSRKYVILERSKDGLMKEPTFDEGYGYYSQFYDYDTEDDAIEAIVKKGEFWRDFIILPVITYEETN